MRRPLAALPRRAPSGADAGPSTGRSRAARRTLVAVTLLTAVSTAHAPSTVTIAPGDTLWGLARANGTTVSDLQRLNDLPGNGTIYAGKTLTLPGGGTGSGPSSAGGGTHRVVAGETLSHLAARYGVSSRSIVEANGLPGSGLIRIGQRLTVPGGGAPSTSTPTHHAGLQIPDGVRGSVAENRATLAARSLPSKDQVRTMVAATARRNGVDPSLALAVAYLESGFQQRVVSPVDAIGVMQVLPSTGRDLSRSAGRTLDLLDTQDNITAGVMLLKQLLRSTGSESKALAGYYQGLGSVARRGVLPQTTAYVSNIGALRQRFS